MNKMTIYLDIVFVENIIMNYIILFATGIICKEKIRQIRIIISSIIGSIYSVAYYIKPQNILYQNGKFIGLYPVKIAILGRTTRIFNN